MRTRFPEEAKTQLIQAEIFQMEGNKAGQYSEIEAAFANKDLSLEARVQMLMQFFESMKSPEAREVGLKLATLTVEHYPASPHAQGIYGAFLQDAGQLKEARSAYLKAVEELNDNFRLWSNIIKIDIELQDFGAMAKHSDQALEYFPNHTLFWFYSGMSNLALRKYEEAIEALEQARSLSYGDEELQFNIHAQLGDAYNGMRDYNKSDAAYEQALNLQPDNTHVLNNYSYYLSLRREKLDKAREMSGKIVAKEPNNATYLDTHAWVLYAQGKYKEALPYIEKAIATGTSSGTILEHYGDILFKLGRKDEALAQWEKARSSGGIDMEQISRKIAEKKLAE
jgi:tetratricopeptide (TPR) repeat protein